MARALAAPIAVLTAVIGLPNCTSSSPGPSAGSVDGGGCFPDGDGTSGGYDTVALTVDDTGFSKTILASQNDAQATVKITNMGTRPHGFEVGCTSVLPAYPMLPKGCPASACFPANAAIAPLAPGASTTITFDTPTPDGLIYPFRSNVAADQDVAGLNDGQWTLM